MYQIFQCNFQWQNFIVIWQAKYNLQLTETSVDISCIFFITLACNCWITVCILSIKMKYKPYTCMCTLNILSARHSNNLFIFPIVFQAFYVCNNFLFHFSFAIVLPAIGLYSLTSDCDESIHIVAKLKRKYIAIYTGKFSIKVRFSSVFWCFCWHFIFTRSLLLVAILCNPFKRVTHCRNLASNSLSFLERTVYNGKLYRCCCC